MGSLSIFSAYLAHHIPYCPAVFAASSGEVLLLGPTGDGAHEDVEWVDLDSVVTVARVLARVAEGYCGAGG